MNNYKRKRTNKFRRIWNTREYLAAYTKYQELLLNMHKFISDIKNKLIAEIKEES